MSRAETCEQWRRRVAPIRRLAERSEPYGYVFVAFAVAFLLGRLSVTHLRVRVRETRTCAHVRTCAHTRVHAHGAPSVSFVSPRCRLPRMDAHHRAVVRAFSPRDCDVSAGELTRPFAVLGPEQPLAVGRGARSTRNYAMSNHACRGHPWWEGSSARRVGVAVALHAARTRLRIT
jgi:hypothetical protein